MKGTLECVKTTLLGGLFVMLPVLLFILLLTEIFDLLVAIATPIADLFPEGTFDNLPFLGLIAIGLLVAASFVIGLVAKSSFGRKFGSAIEEATLAKLPLYATLRRLTRTIAGSPEAKSFHPALLEHGDGSAEPAFLMEEHDDGRAIVLLPWSPTALAGSLRLVPRERVRLLNTDVGEFTRVLGQWGVGAKEMVEKGTK